MYTRFYNSIINPKNIVQYRNDSLFKVFLYVFFFAVLLSTRITIDTLTFDGLSPATKEQIKMNFEDVDPSCAIIDTNLSCDTKASHLLYTDTIVAYYIDSNPTLDLSLYRETGYFIVLFEDAFHFVVGGTEVFIVEVSSLSSSIQNFDFSLQTSDPTLFYNTIFNEVDAVLLANKSIWAPTLIIADFLMNFAMYMLFIMMSAWFLRIRFKQVKFKQLFVMTVYSSTALYIILIINSLYNLNFFIIAILLIVALRQNSQLSIELYRRLSKNLDK